MFFRATLASVASDGHLPERQDLGCAGQRLRFLRGLARHPEIARPL